MSSDQESRKNPRQKRPEAILFSEKSLPGLRIHDLPRSSRAVLLQQSLWRLPACGGLGIEQHVDEDFIPRQEATLRKGAIAPWQIVLALLCADADALAKFYKFSLDAKWKDLPRKPKRAAVSASGDDEIKFTYEDGVAAYEQEGVRGVVTNIQRRYRETESEWAREEMAKYFSTCLRACNAIAEAGSPVRQDRRQAYRRDLRSSRSRRAGEWFETVPKALNAQQTEIADGC